MPGFLFRLETADGVAANPPKLDSAVPNWKAGDSIYLGRRLRVIGIRDDDADQPPVLVVFSSAPKVGTDHAMSAGGRRAASAALPLHDA